MSKRESRVELVEETARWQEGEMENEWESLALVPGWPLCSEHQAKRREMLQASP